MMFGPMNDHLENAQQGLVAIIHHLASIEDYLSRILDQSSQRDPASWSIAASATLAPGAVANVSVGSQQLTQIPQGKRFLLQRVATVAPAATGPCAIYANQSGSADATSLREVIPAPTLYADAVALGTVIRGGSQLLAVFNGVPATGGVCSIRYEGLLFDDVDPLLDVGH